MPELVLNAEAFITFDPEDEEEEFPIYNLVGGEQETGEINGVIELVHVTILCTVATVIVSLVPANDSEIVLFEDSSSLATIIVPRRITTDYAGNQDIPADDVSRVPYFNIGRLTLNVSPSDPEGWVGTVELRIWWRNA